MRICCELFACFGINVNLEEEDIADVQAEDRRDTHLE